VTAAIFLTPAPGRVVRFPPTMRILSAAGLNVPDDDLFWARRLRDGDVIANAAGAIWDNYLPAQAGTPTDWDNGTTDWDAPP
jgi:hypothetical protein